MRRSALSLVAVLVLVAMVAPGSAALAAREKVTYEWQICPPIAHHHCIARAPNGDTLQLTGKGTFTLNPRSATGGGTFTVKDKHGKVLEKGTFAVDRLAGWKPYGAATDEQIKFVRRTEGFTLPKGSAGGLAVLGAFDKADKTRANLKVDCLLGDNVPKGAKEGVRVTVFGFENFDKIVGEGATLFVKK